MSIKCGICGKGVQKIELKIPIPVSNMDKEIGVKRTNVYLCCNKLWLKSFNGYENLSFDAPNLEIK